MWLARNCGFSSRDGWADFRTGKRIFQLKLVLQLQKYMYNLKITTYSFNWSLLHFSFPQSDMTKLYQDLHYWNHVIKSFVEVGTKSLHKHNCLIEQPGGLDPCTSVSCDGIRVFEQEMYCRLHNSVAPYLKNLLFQMGNRVCYLIIFGIVELIFFLYFTLVKSSKYVAETHKHT